MHRLGHGTGTNLNQCLSGLTPAPGNHDFSAASGFPLTNTVTITGSKLCLGYLITFNGPPTSFTVNSGLRINLLRCPAGQPAYRVVYSFGL